MKKDLIFSPQSIGHLTLKNRLAHVATIGNYGANGLPTKQQIAYYERRAKGGVGLIITEGMSIHPSSQPNPAVVRAYAPEAQPGLLELTTAVHRHGVPILMQLWHVGRQQLWGPVGSPWGVSPFPDALSGVVPHVMTVEEIKEIQQAYVQCAINAQKAGFDGVELHGAHGYLITQFLSPWSNIRTDEYGSTFDGRMRFLRETLNQIRKACGEQFVIGLKLSGSEFVEGGLTIEDTKQIVSDLQSLGLVDFVAINQGNFSLSLELHVPDMHFPHAPFADLIADIRSAANGLPIMAIGRIVDKAGTTRLLENGTTDLIGMARALISDPDLPNKWAEENREPVRDCISCNVCWGVIHTGKSMLCIHNPEVGSEAGWDERKRCETPKQVHIIGGGPAGMEAAWVAAMRGHSVSLWEKEEELGGQLRFLKEMPGLSNYGEIINFQKRQLDRYGVDVHCSSVIQKEDIANFSEATIVFATGSVPQSPPEAIMPLDPIYPDDNRLLSLNDKPGTAVLFDEDGGYYAYGPLMKLVSLGWSVKLITTKTEIGMGLDYLSRIGLHRRLRENGVEVLTGIKVNRIEGNDMYLVDQYTGAMSSLPRPNIAIWAGPRVAKDGLWRAHLGDTRFLRPIGDAYSPRKIISAIHEGHLVGRSI